MLWLELRTLLHTSYLQKPPCLGYILIIMRLVEESVIENGAIWWSNYSCWTLWFLWSWSKHIIFIFCKLFTVRQNQPCMGYTAGCKAVSYPPLYVIHCRLWSCQLSRLSKTYLTIHTYIGDLQFENFRGSYQP